MKIAFDVGGVLSKYPHVFRPIIATLVSSHEVYVISDMHPVQEIIDALQRNGIYLPENYIKSADYETHGEMCKAVLCEDLGIDLLIDDFPGYVATGKHVRLLVMPDPTEPYYHDEWVGSEKDGNFGRRKKILTGEQSRKIKELRDASAAPLLVCKAKLIANEWDVEKAKNAMLREFFTEPRPGLMRD